MLVPDYTLVIMQLLRVSLLGFGSLPIKKMDQFILLTQKLVIRASWMILWKNKTWFELLKACMFVHRVGWMVHAESLFPILFRNFCFLKQKGNINECGKAWWPCNWFLAYNIIRSSCSLDDCRVSSHPSLLKKCYVWWSDGSVRCSMSASMWIS